MKILINSMHGNHGSIITHSYVGHLINSGALITITALLLVIFHRIATHSELISASLEKAPNGKKTVSLCVLG